jgi:penicillin-binding protein 1A
VKNRYFSGADRTILQKIRESILALYLESTMDKDAILRAYLNHIYLGNNIYGIQTALEEYIGDRTLTE